jgi:hypothetical protein
MTARRRDDDNLTTVRPARDDRWLRAGRKDDDPKTTELCPDNTYRTIPVANSPVPVSMDRPYTTRPADTHTRADTSH